MHARRRATCQAVLLCPCEVPGCRDERGGAGVCRKFERKGETWRAGGREVGGEGGALFSRRGRCIGTLEWSKGTAAELTLSGTRLRLKTDEVSFAKCAMRCVTKHVGVRCAEVEANPWALGLTS